MGTRGKSFLRHAGRLALPVLAAVGVAACGGGDVAAPGSGTLRVGLTDGPACGFDHVYVTVREVRIHASADAEDRGGGWTSLPVTPPKRIDLLELTNGRMEELGQARIAAGRYTQLRLVLTSNGNSVVPTGGSATSLFTPSAQQTGIKVIHPFTVERDRTVDLVLDFDACRSIVQRGNGSYGLKPVVTGHLVDVAAIAGTVSGPAGVRVSVQKNGEVIRGTVPVAASGAFSVPFLDPSRAPYDVVFSAPDRSTAVVTNVPAALGATTQLGTIPMPASTAVPPSRGASGRVDPAAARETAEVRALQTVGTVPVVEVAFANVDALSGDYALTLPVDAPRLASYATTLPLAFTAQGGAAQYTLQARAPGFLARTAPVNLGTSDATGVNFDLPPAP